MSVVCDVVSIGCLSRNRFWSEPEPVRPAHATTVVLRERNQCILVDPSTPGELLAGRLAERTGLRPSDVDCVFLTSFTPVHRRGLELFDKADWLMGPVEIQAIRGHLSGLVEASERSASQPDELITDELRLLTRMKPASDKLTSSIHLFPTPGPTPGHASLLLATPTLTSIVAGDAIVTRDYYEHGRVFENCQNVDQARESLAELAELADQVIPGHDNLFVPTNRL